MPTLVRAIDVSSHQSTDLRSLIGEHQPKHVIVKLYLPVESIPQEHTRAQIRSARAAGCSVGGYVWCYRDEDPRKTVRDAVALARSCGVELPVLWLDCETYTVNGEVRDPGPDAPWLRAAVDECRALGVRPGIYTGGWWWREYMNNSRAFADLPLWTAEYDGNTNIDDVTLFGGWTRASGKQWATKLPGGGELDRNVFVDDVCQGTTTPEPEPAPAPTLAELEAASPGIGQNILDWQRARYRNGENPNDFGACRTHLRNIGCPDPGPIEPVGFRRPTIEDLAATTPNIRQNLAEWQQARRQNGQDPNDYAACRTHLRNIGCPDPGPTEFLGFFS
jgi:hypothetical protein